MCGLVGFVGPAQPDALRKMTDSLTHRGPDSRGEVSRDNVHLGFRRLSVIDLESGQQPLTTEDDRYTLCMNGEIYNHAELRHELEGEGYTFKTDHADSEALLVGYQAWGTAVLDRLEGMFAFVIHDRARRELFGARDRMGKKPLYLTTRKVGAMPLVFASEMCALLAHPEVARRVTVDDRSLASYLAHDYVAGRRSIYSPVERLLPGEAFTYRLDEERLTRSQWYAPEVVPQGRPSIDVAASGVIDRLGSSVDKRLVADVPVGVFLSGGIDSSLLTAFACRTLGASRVRTFSIAFDEATFDESDAAAAVAGALGTEHHVRHYRSEDLLARVDAVLTHMDEPYADPSILPYERLCAFAREEVTVALSGDGGDELFCGYDPFLALPAARLFNAVPEPLVGGALALVDRFASGDDGNVALSFAARRFLGGVSGRGPLRAALWMAPFSPKRLAKVAPGLGDIDVDETWLAGFDARATKDDAADTTRFFQRLYLPDDILVKADRGSMMHGLEVRAPFLDSELVRYANALPTELKLRPGLTKRVLKHAALLDEGQGALLSEAIVHRRKKGFGVPVASWIRGPLKDRFCDQLLSDWPSAVDVFDRNEIRRLLERHLSGQENLYKELWALFALNVWARGVVQG